MAAQPDDSPPPGAAAARSDAWYAQLRPVYSGGNRLQLLRGGDELFPAMEAAIAQARHEVWLATYIFHHDAAGERLAAALAQAARRGVRVRVVVDGFGSLASLEVLRGWLEPHGVALAVFRPLTRWWNWLQPGQLRRLHQKLCAVDEAQAFVGGINIIGDRNDLNHGATTRPRLDYAVALSGPVVLPVAQTVRAVWSRAAFGQDWRGEVLALARSAEPLDRARRLLQRLRLPRPVPADDLQPVQAALVVRDNLSQRRTIERSLIEALGQAREQVDLITPYFYPARGFRRALIRAARRGVRVRLLLQGKVDYRLAALAARVLYDELLAEGIEIHEYTPAFLHAKIVQVDGRWATVGSSNIDPLSLLLNLEANVVVRDALFARALATEFEHALAVSRRVTMPPFRAGPVAAVWRGLVAGLAHAYLRLAGRNGRY